MTVRRAMTMPSCAVRTSFLRRTVSGSGAWIRSRPRLPCLWRSSALDRSCNSTSPYFRDRLPMSKALSGDAHSDSDVGDRTTRAPLDESSSSLSGQWSVTVCHRAGCLVERLFHNSHSHAEDQTVCFSRAPTTSMPTTSRRVVWPSKLTDASTSTTFRLAPKLFATQVFNESAVTPRPSSILG